MSLTSKAKHPLTTSSSYVLQTSNTIQVLELFQNQKAHLTDLPEKFIRGQQTPCSHFRMLVLIKAEYFPHSFIFFKPTHACCPHCLLFCKCSWGLLMHHAQPSWQFLVWIWDSPSKAAKINLTCSRRKVKIVFHGSWTFLRAGVRAQFS